MVVTVNTDDPMMFQTCLADEYRLLEKECGWAQAEICRLILSAIESSWSSDERRRSLAAEFRRDPAWRE
jgi:adenosine deaminase